MATIILVTGGARSGKSNFAMTRAMELPGRHAFLATCPVVDDEMAERVRRHQRARPEDWLTLEEPLELANAIRDRAGNTDVLLVDCLTLWINNLMFRGERDGLTVSEDDVARAADEVLEACSAHGGTVIFVTNEVGMGIVPENPDARTFRDLAGRCNQVVASRADEVHLLVSGVALRVK